MEQLDWRLEYLTLFGELSGFLRALTKYDIPESVTDRIVEFAEEKEKHFKKIMEREEGTDNSEDPGV